MPCFRRFFNKQQGSFNLENGGNFAAKLQCYQPKYFINLEGHTTDSTTTDPVNQRSDQIGSNNKKIVENNKKKNKAPKIPKTKNEQPPEREPPPVPTRDPKKSPVSKKASKKPAPEHVSIIQVNQSPPQTKPVGIIKITDAVVENHVNTIWLDNDGPNETSDRPSTSSDVTEVEIMKSFPKSPKFIKQPEEKMTNGHSNFETIISQQSSSVVQVKEPSTKDNPRHELPKKKNQAILNGHISETDSDDNEIRCVEQTKEKEPSTAKSEPKPTPVPEPSKPKENKRSDSTRKSDKSKTKKVEELTAPPIKKNARKRGIISEKPDQSETKDLTIETFEKDYQSQELIKRAITANDFLNNMMDVDRLDAVTQAMTPCTLEAYSYIITEGESGSYFYVSAEGTFEVLKEGKVIKSFSEGVVFGELAILYKAKRFASIRLTTPGKVWRLERKVFQKIMMQSGRKEREENIRFLSSVSVLKDVPQPVLSQISDILKREFHATGATIIQQGDPGDKFYIIRGGSVNVIKTDAYGQEKLVSTLHRGAYFGEQALLHQDRRLASIIANPPGAECLTLDRLAFVNLLGGIEMIRNTKPVDNIEPPKYNSLEKNKKYEHIQLHDLTIVGTLGVGGYGRVELVHYKKTKETFALKYLKKIDMVQQQRQEHAYSEKDIMLSCDSDFIARLYKTYRDKKYLYFLMEVCLGGDVWTVLQKKKFFDEKVAKFMTGCVVEAFEYMHLRNMIYRDLKPENLMLDERGYIKLVDFGFAKRVGPSQKTWTFAGTPEYVSPEIILNKGHDRAVDYWALGVFIHELLVGKPPFRGKDHMKTYSLILRGIDVIPMHQKIPKKAQDLIKRLCRQSPVERLGYQKNGVGDIKSNSWFKGFDWVKLRERTMPAPLVRPVKNNMDRSNFDEYPRDRDEPADETSGWDFDF